ncbi:MAG: sensor histidine kinase [Gammaproteobacteria bacterium]
MLILITVLPALLLAWLGVTVYSDSRQMAEDRKLRLAQLELRNLDELLLEYFREHERVRLPTLNYLRLDEPRLRELAQSDPLIRQAFVINAEGKREFPAPDTPLSNREQSFLQRTQLLWQNPEILSANQPESSKPAPVAQQSASSRSYVGQLRAFSSAGKTQADSVRSTETKESANPSGWFIWFDGMDRHFILWLKREDGRTVGIELNPARVISDLITRLPDGDDPDYLDHQIRIIGPQGQLLYQWGKAAPETTPLLTQAISFPLHGWRAEFVAGNEAGEGAWEWLLALALLLPLMLVGGVYVYREQAREMREAGQRVSFVNQVSHELKTPLTNIRLYAEMLEDALDEADEKERRYLHVIGEESRRLTRMIGNVLSFAREERGTLRIQRQAIVPDEAIAHVVRNFQPSLEAAGIRLTVIGSVSEPLSLDADALEQILGNLLSNVEKYAANGGAATIHPRLEREHLIIRLEDKGPGIPAAERERIFEPFHRVSSRLTDGVAGTGIGLSIARRLARLHGGDLKLLDSAEGAVFELSLNVQGC